jgi:exocyst complex component 7
MDRTTQALSELNNSNLRSNQQAMSELKVLLKAGQSELEHVFREMLNENARAVEPLHYITKRELAASRLEIYAKISLQSFRFR